VALVIESLIYLALHLWSTRRLFREALAEIQAGRWTPPPNPPVILARHKSGRAIRLLQWFSALPILIALTVGAQGQTKDAILIIAFWSVIFISAITLFDREKIKAVRKAGLWPQLGETPTTDHVKNLAQAGEMLLAIKLYRQIHPASLLDAKAAVEKLAVANPTAVKPAQQNSTDPNL
jgi:hypothetical protein